EFGLYGYELSRFSGHWVGMTAPSEVVESAATVDLDAIAGAVAGWKPAPDVMAESGWQPPQDGVHNRWPDLPSPAIEARFAHKQAALQAYARINAIDRLLADAPRGRVGIVSCGKAHLDLLEALRL